MSESQKGSSLDYYDPEGKILRLDVSRTPRPYPKDESFWDLEIRRLLKLVHSHLTVTNKSQQRLGASSFDKPHLSIGIFGTYGSGKTSLLKTVVERIREEDLPQDFKVLENKVYSLPIIEPSTLSTHSTFLYSFLATALEEDLNRNRQVGGGSSHSGAQRSELGTRQQAPGQTHVLTPVQQAFQEVSEYLQVVDDPGLDSRDHDPLGLSLERLERHTSGLRLADKLSKMIDALANRLGGPDSVLLMPVDDADMARDGLISTLETYRSYLMHPRLVPVFTFTDRLAEELIRTHFNQKLALEEVRALSGKRAEAATYDESTRKLAYQYLVKLFPVRNRLRLGMAAARVQAAKYQTGDATVEVKELLTTASKLLYGPEESATDSAIQRALRPSTLRRQLQVIDAVLDSGVEQLRTDRKALAWPRVFSNTTWSLLNVHRDALQEFGLHMEDLYSRSPRDLERHVRATLLRQPPEVRRRILWSWRYRDEERQVQVLSLLAAAMYRPRLFCEEPAGDDPAEWATYEDERAELVESENPKDRGEEGGSAFPEKARQLPVFDAVIWFLELWFGFYLPQVLGSDLDADPSKETGYQARSAEAGWTLKSAPSQAMKLARRSEGKWPGMMSLNPAEVAALLSTASEFLTTKQGSEAGHSSKNRKKEIEQFHAIHIWCFYGVGRDGKPWAGFSFWRGLSLLGRLMKCYQSIAARKKQIANLEKKETNQLTVAEKERLDQKLNEAKEGRAKAQQQFVEIIQEHYKAAREPGYRYKAGFQGFVWPDELNKGEKLEEEGKKLEEEGKKPEEEDKRFEKLLKGLEGELQEWLERCEAAWTVPLVLEESSSKAGSFIRRLHGDLMLGTFWRELEEVFLEPPENQKDDLPTPSEGELESLRKDLEEFIADVDKLVAKGDSEQLQDLEKIRDDLEEIKREVDDELAVSGYGRFWKRMERLEIKSLSEKSQKLLAKADQMGLTVEAGELGKDRSDRRAERWELWDVAKRFEEVLSRYFNGVVIQHPTEPAGDKDTGKNKKKPDDLGKWLVDADIFKKVHGLRDLGADEADDSGAAGDGAGGSGPPDEGNNGPTNPPPANGASTEADQQDADPQ